MNKATTEYVMRTPKSNDDLWIKNVGPVPDPNEIRIGFRDGTFATFKDAGSLQEFLDKLARFHELEKDLEIARKAFEMIRDEFGIENRLATPIMQGLNMKAIAEKALEQIEHKE